MRSPLALMFLLGSLPVLTSWVQDPAKPDQNAYARDQGTIQRGREVFTRYCAACHNFETDEIGPNLSGVTAQAPKAWLRSFIRYSPEMLARGDARAVRVHERFKNVMPPLPLTDAELEEVLAYIHTFSAKTPTSAEAAAGALADPIPDRVTPSDLTLVLERVLTIPPSANEPPATRINKLLAVLHGDRERLFIHDLRGKLHEIRDHKPHVYLDAAVEFPRFIHQPGLGTGLGSFAFHPAFAENGLFYTTHTEPAGAAPADFPLRDSTPVRLQWVLVEWTAKDPRGEVFSGTRRELVRADMHTQIHGFQEVTFNPLAKRGDTDYGVLYLASGDGGAGVTKHWASCCAGGIWGTVLRIDPAGRTSRNGKYGIPKDNPSANKQGTPAEVWVRGFRNPHRISWDLTGSRKMFITNIGQHAVEEVELGVAGAHYGWPEREGTFRTDVPANPKSLYPRPPKDAVPYTYPVVQYDHDEGNAISGGFVYAGDRIAPLKGKYVFGDITRGRIFFAEVSRMELGKQAPIYEFAIEANGNKATLEALTRNKRVDLRFGQDSKGDLYIFTKADGAVWKVVDCRRSR